MQLAPQGKVYSYFAENVEGNPLHPFTINFYIGNRMVPFESEKEAQGYVVIGENDIETFKNKYSDKYQIIQLPNSRYRSCDSRQYTNIYSVILK